MFCLIFVNYTVQLFFMFLFSLTMNLYFFFFYIYIQTVILHVFDILEIGVILFSCWQECKERIQAYS